MTQETLNSASHNSTGIVSGSIVDIKVFIKQFLKPDLPYSLPLLRRAQFHEKHKSTTPNAEIRVFTLAESGTSLVADDLYTAQSPPSQHPWLAAHVDLTVSGQTQVWTYASWEPQLAALGSPGESAQHHPLYLTHHALVSALFQHIRTNHIPRLSTTPPDQWLRLKSEGKILSEPYSRTKVLFGTLAECLWPFLDSFRNPSLPPPPLPATTSPASTPQAVTRSDRGYLKYIVTTPHTDHTPAAPTSLPSLTFHFAPIPPSHLQLILDRTTIPRTLETLLQLPNVGLFADPSRPIAWGLLGKDSSISSLHTEPEFRGRGFAELVGRQLINEQTKFFEDDADDGVVYSMADVSEANLASRRVMEKLGGVVRWKVGWLEIDLGEV